MCGKCGMPLCMKDRTSNEKGHERKQSCLHEHKHSDNIYLGCGFISRSPSQFVMPPELILYPIVRANEGFDSTNNVSPSPRKRSKTSSSATTANSDFSSALYSPQQHRSSGRSAAHATGRGKRIYASSSESLPGLQCKLPYPPTRLCPQMWTLAKCGSH